MKKVEIVGYKRTDFSKSAPTKLRQEAMVPCVLYGGKENVHFAAPMILFKDVVYTPNACFVTLNIEGTEYEAALQAVQFHPVSEVLMHADFLLLQDDKPLRMEIPVKIVGESPGLLKGGKLALKLRGMKVEALPKYMPEVVEVSIEGLDLGKSVRVNTVKAENFKILNNPSITVATVTIPRALKSAQGK